MSRTTFLPFLLLLAVEIVTFAAEPGFPRFAAASVHPLATEAAVQAYKKGGNAVDAAVATGLTLGVVDGHNSGIGGGCFFVIRAADGSVTCIDGREMAPAKASRDMYVIDGKLDNEASKTGALAPGVPGALRAYELALKKHGKLTLADLLLPAAEIAEKGFPIDEVYERKIAAMVDPLKKFPASAAIFFKADGSPLKKGDLLVQKDLAETYRAIAKHGTAWFYGGDYAQTVETWMKENGGIMTADDFTNYKAVEREPVRAKYRGYDIVAMPPPSSGGVHVAQILQIMEHFPIRDLSSAQRVHVITEAMKLAFADRAHWLGDPDFAKVPRGLVDAGYAKDLAAKIDLTKVTAVPSHNTPPRWEGDIFGKHTTHLCTADVEGNWVALNQTINTAFGSKVIIPGTGVLLNDEMDDFAVQPGVPNAFKLIGAEANAVAPGKRPLSSMSPTIVFKDGQPILCTGAAGGPTIITQALLLISNILDRGMEPNAALKQPRFHHQWAPDELKIEKAFGDETLAELTKLGHKLESVTAFGACQAILWDADRKLLVPAHDPRVPGKADGQ
jgi:gamma-glutamyltranspeptidase/glutathione hydrolase